MGDLVAEYLRGKVEALRKDVAGTPDGEAVH
jgi:hypothetical protein